MNLTCKRRASRHWRTLLVCCLGVGPSLAQNLLLIEPQSQSISGGLGQGNLVAVFSTQGLGPAGTFPNVKFQLSSTTADPDNFLVVSPSSGTTPTQIVVAVNPSLVGISRPGTFSYLLTFTTTDQTPPSTSVNEITVTLGAPGPPVVQSVVDSASLKPAITPGGMVSVLGTSLAPSLSATYNDAGLFPTSLANATVTFNGIAAPILSTSPGQINVVAPYEIAGQKTVQVVVTQYPQTQYQQTSPPVTVEEADTSLALFATAQLTPGQPGILNCGSAQNCSANSAGNPAPPGSVIVMFANGGGIWDRHPPVGPGQAHVDGLDGSVSLLAQSSSRARLRSLSADSLQPLSTPVRRPIRYGAFSRSTPLCLPESAPDHKRQC